MNSIKSILYLSAPFASLYRATYGFDFANRKAKEIIMNTQKMLEMVNNVEGKVGADV